MLQAERNIRKQLANARLPGTPEVLLRLLECCQDEHPDLGRLGRFLECDPGLAATVMGMANGPAYRSTGAAITSVQQALRTIGADMLRTLVVNDAVNYISKDAHYLNDAGLGNFWRRSLKAAIAAKEIARLIDYPDADEAYLAGLLHDIGRLGLLAIAGQDETSPGPLSRSIVASESEPDRARDRVGSRAEISHHEAGALLVECWQLDSMLADSLLYHQEPVARLGNAHPLIQIVQLAHLLASGTADAEKVCVAALAINLDGPVLEQLQEEISTQFSTLSAMLGLDTSGDKHHADTGKLPAGTVGQHLSDELRNMILAANAGRIFARQTSAAALHDAIRRSARLLFCFDDVALFLRSRDGASLSGALAGERRQRLAAMTVSLSAGGAIALAAAASAPAVIRRDEARLGLAEEQLMNALSAECLVCLPVTTGGGRLLGVIVGGAGFEQIPAFRQHARLLRVFAGQAASALDQESSVRAKLQSQMASMAEEYRAASRRMAHEVNNPLSIIKNYLTLLGDKSRSNKPIHSELSILHEEIDRVSGLVDAMAEVAPLAGAPQGVTEVGKAMREVVYLFKHTEFAAPAINIIATTHDPLAVIEGSADLLRQILVNLMKNAVEALDGAGEIGISDEGQVNRDGRLFLELAVRDNGPGIPAAMLADLFAPLASSKGERRGIGLSIVHGLVAKMQGMIMCRSSHRGTVFQILLPIPVSATVAVPAQMTIPAVDAL